MYQQELQEKGFSTLPAANSPKRPIDMTTIYVVNPKISNDIVLALQKEITAQVVQGLPEWLKNGSTNTNSSTEQENPNLRFNTEADILIILGSELNVNKQ
jgi:hypothetical protein